MFFIFYRQNIVKIGNNGNIENIQKIYTTHDGWCALKTVLIA